MKARLLFRDKIVYPDGAIVAMRAWSVPKTERTPEGIKYSLAYMDKEGNRLAGYDNAEGKGHHHHEGRLEEPFAFDSIEKLSKQFLDEIKKIRGGGDEN